MEALFIDNDANELLLFQSYYDDKTLFDHGLRKLRFQVQRCRISAIVWITAIVCSEFLYDWHCDITTDAINIGLKV